MKHLGLLYNLKSDPVQQNNLYAVSEMKALLERYKGGEACAPHTR